MIGTLILIAIVAVVVSVIPMNPTLKNIIYLILGIAALFQVLPLIGIGVPSLN